jgi:hypothetical protein
MPTQTATRDHDTTLRRLSRTVACNLRITLECPYAEMIATAMDVECECCSELIDMHLYPSNLTSVDPLTAEMNAAEISRGILYTVYASNNTFPPDANTQVNDMIQERNGRMCGQASLDTSRNLSETRVNEVARLFTYLSKPKFLGTHHDIHVCSSMVHSKGCLSIKQTYCCLGFTLVLWLHAVASLAISFLDTG